MPDPDDRHVLAAAIRGSASAIVTFNEKDFPAGALSAFGIHTLHPDQFIRDLDGVDPGTVIDAAKYDWQHYQNPPLSVDDYIGGLEAAGAPMTAAHLRKIKVLFES